MGSERGPQGEHGFSTPPVSRVEGERSAPSPERRREQMHRWGALLLLIGVIWLVFELTIRSSLFNIGAGLVEHTDALPPQSFVADRLRITGVNDDVKLTPGRGEAILVEATRHAFGWNAGLAGQALERLEIKPDTQGDTLVINLRSASRLAAAVGRVPFVTLRVTVPAGTPVEVGLVSGDIEIEGVQGDLNLRTVSGHVRVAKVKGALFVNSASGDVEVRNHAGALSVETTSGAVRINDVNGDVRLSTVSGDVSVEYVSGAVQARTISGAITTHSATGASLALESTSGDVRFDGKLAQGSVSTLSTISGDVWVQLANPDDLFLDLRTTSGDLNSDLPLGGGVRERRHLSGRIGAGATRLTITTASGDVTIGTLRR